MDLFGLSGERERIGLGNEEGEGWVGGGARGFVRFIRMERLDERKIGLKEEGKWICNIRLREERD